MALHASAPETIEARRRWIRRLPFVAVPALGVAAALLLAPGAQAEGPGYGGTADKLSVNWSATSTPAPAATSPATAPPTTTPSTATPSTASASTSRGSATTTEPTSTTASPATPEPAASVDQQASGSPAASGNGSAITGGLVGGHGRSAAVRAAAQGAPPRPREGPTLTVTGVGFRGLSVVSVRVGTGEPVVARVDATGTLNLSVAPGPSDVAAVGTSVVAVGRAPSGTSKTLIGSVPPRPTAHGPVDAVPWVAVAVLLALAVSSLAPRLRGRAASGVAR